MNKIPEELRLHIFTYIKVLSSELRPLLEINKEIRNLLWYKKHHLKDYPWTIDESIACISNSYMEYIREIIERKRDAELNVWDEEIPDEEMPEIEHYSYMNFPSF